MKLFMMSLISIGLSLLDLFGIILIGLIGSLATLSATNQEPGGLTKGLLRILNLEQLSTYHQLIVLGVSAGLFLIGKTLVSFFIQKKLAIFLQARITELISRFLRSILSWDMSGINAIPKRQLIQSMQNGIPSLVSGVIMPVFVLVSDVALILILSAALFFTEPVLAFTTAALFALTATYLHFTLSIRQRNMGSELAAFSLKSHLAYETLVEGFREALVRNIRENIILEIESDRTKSARIHAEFSLVSQVNKYAFEVTMVIGAIIIVSQQFLVSNSSRAVAIVGVFIAASFRVGPAVLRIQYSLLTVRRAIAQSEFTLKILRKLKLESVSVPMISHKKFPKISETNSVPFEFSNVSFKYNAESEHLLSNFSFIGTPGEHVAIVGRSGVGKTTLVDLLVGALKPSEGYVKLFEMNPRESLNKLQGIVAYLPQSPLTLQGTIRENLCFGYDIKDVNEEYLWEALSLAKADTFVSQLPSGLDFVLSDNGQNISGGQRQRLGLARAFLTKPKLMILDEATSALDNETQNDISEVLNSLKGTMSLIMIAHRLKSIEYVDRVIQFNGPGDVSILDPKSFLKSLDSLKEVE
jgi:ABC-type bacteriocin/lantibiotic exporter with double-glycine peptidase domain